MTGLVDRFYDELVYLYAHVRPSFVTLQEYLEWRQSDPAGIDDHIAETFAKFVRQVAVDANAPNLIAAADNILSAARAIENRPGWPLDPETGLELETLPHRLWKERLDAKAIQATRRKRRNA